MSGALPPTILPEGTAITDRLVVVRRIGAGGVGEVYEVRHKFTRHRRAVKVLHARYREDAEMVARFLREASAAGRIGNPHIVETFDAGYLADGSPFIVMEFLEGSPLDEVLRREGRLDVERSADLMVQACTALQAAHDANIVHRDLKPGNLFVMDPDGRPFVKVLDFGISKFQAEDGGDQETTQPDITMGTPLYMAPEQLRSAKAADARSDVYSLGVIFYELVSGVVPFEAESLTELLVKVANGEHRPLHVVDPGLPRELSAIAGKAMDKDPARRFQTAQALGEHLASFARGRAAPEALRLTLGATTERGGSRSAPALRWAVWLLALFSLGAVGWRKWGATARTETPTVALALSVPPPTPPAAQPGSAPPSSSSDAAPQAPVVAATPAVGTVDIACIPVACAVTVDGKRLGETPLLDQKLSGGVHTAVLLNLETRTTKTRTFRVTPGVPTKLIVTF